MSALPRGRHHPASAPLPRRWASSAAAPGRLAASDPPRRSRGPRGGARVRLRGWRCRPAVSPHRLPAHERAPRCWHGDLPVPSVAGRCGPRTPPRPQAAPGRARPAGVPAANAAHDRPAGRTPERGQGAPLHQRLWRAARAALTLPAVSARGLPSLRWLRSRHETECSAAA